MTQNYTSLFGGELAEIGVYLSADSMPDPIGKGIGGTDRWPPHEFGGLSAVLGGANALTEPSGSGSPAKLSTHRSLP